MNERKPPLAFLDTETTGTKPGVHELLEIGVVLVNPEPPYAMTDSFAIKVKPQRIQDADHEALQINRYNPAEWEDALPEGEAMQELYARMQRAVPWGWNVGFDRAFLEPAMNRAGISVEQCGFYSWYDLKTDFVRWAKLVGRAEEFAPRFSLSAARRAFGLEIEDAHRALPDAVSTYQIFLRLEDEFQKIADATRNITLPL